MYVIGHRLHQNTCAAALVLDRTEQSGAERQHAVAVTRCSFGEKYDGCARGHAANDFVHRVTGLMTAPAVDENRALHFCGYPDQWPARDFALGDKGNRRNRADDDDIDPGHVV